MHLIKMMIETILLVLVISTSGVKGFIPFIAPNDVGFTRSFVATYQSTDLQQQKQQQHRQRQLLFASTEERTLTEQDENVLFGEEINSLINAEYSSDKRERDMYGNILPDPAKRRGSTSSDSPFNDKLLFNDLDHVPDNPLVNKLRTMRSIVSNCPQIWYELASILPNDRALYDNHLCDTKIDLSFSHALVQIQKSASIFNKILSSKRTKHIAIFAENSAYWLLVDHGIQLAGGVSAVRGADAPLDELRYVYEHSDSASAVVLQDVQLLQKLHKDSQRKNLKSPLGFYNTLYGPVKTVIIMHKGRKNDDKNVEVAQQIASALNIDILFLSDLLDQANPIDTIPDINRSNLATIVYTSGTTGNPKGVMLTHGNLLHQLSHRLAPTKPYAETEPLPGETMVSLLPVWHITERTFELWMLSRGCNVVYSTIRTFKKDLAVHKPHWAVLVPRVLEKIATGVQEKFSTSGPAVKVLSKLFTSVGKVYSTNVKVAIGLTVNDIANGPLEKIGAKVALSALKPFHAIGQKLVWSKVRDGFGGRLKVIISGGSALAGGLETFYETAGLTICVGYGLTECSPLLAFRRTDANLVTGGCIGKACIDTEIRVVDPEAKPNGDQPRPAVPIGQVGVLLGRGPQVMKGYYKNPEATSKAIDKYGWFDTGDLGRVNPATGDIILTGRVKDTIVLSNGENIEPVPIEDAIIGDVALVDQVMVTSATAGSEGDAKSLIAITVLNPQSLYDNGFLKDAEQLKVLQDAMEVVNCPTCTIEEYEETVSDVLLPIRNQLRSNPDVTNVLTLSVKDVLTKSGKFRKWEQVQDFCITMEPFAMVNGQLTQSYKVKRAQVTQRYQNEF